MKIVVVQSFYQPFYSYAIGNGKNGKSPFGVFGGGKGQNTSVSQYSKINITDNSNNVYLYGNIYGGSALGAISGNSYVDIKDTSSEQNSITINGNVYGGGKGDTNTSAISRGNTNVTIDGGDYQNVKAFGGCNINGSIGGTVNVLN